MTADRLAGSLVLLLAATYLLMAHRIAEVNVLSAIGPRVFPYLLAAAFGLLGLLLFASRDRAHEPWSRGELRDLGITVGAMIAYALAINVLGYVVATFAFLTAMLAYLAPDRKPARWWTNLAVAAGFSLVTYHLFTNQLGVVLPRGVYPF